MDKQQEETPLLPSPCSSTRLCCGYHCFEQCCSCLEPRGVATKQVKHDSESEMTLYSIIKIRADGVKTWTLNISIWVTNIFVFPIIDLFVFVKLTIDKQPPVDEDAVLFVKENCNIRTKIHFVVVHDFKIRPQIRSPLVSNVDYCNEKFLLECTPVLPL